MSSGRLPQPIRNLGFFRSSLRFLRRHKYLENRGLFGRDERIRTSDPLNPIYIRTPATTGSQQLSSARRGETRKITALSAPYTHPEQSYGDGTVRPLLGWFSYIYIRMREETLSKQLLRLKAKTSWSWEKMCREFHRVMGYEGPSHTTLFRYASGGVKRPNVLTERYVGEAIHKLTAELSQQ